MVIPDLLELPAGHSPSPWRLPVWESGPGGAKRYAMLPDGLRLVAVGWLGTEVPGTGSVPDACIDRLVAAYADRRFRIREGMHGLHPCGICLTHGPTHRGLVPPLSWKGKTYRLLFEGHHLIRRGDVVFMCPRGILHYIADHAYRPPGAFLDAIRRGRFLRFDDLREVPASVWQEHLDRYRSTGLSLFPDPPVPRRRRRREEREPADW